MTIALIVHGGAWNIPDDQVAPHQAGCRAAMAAGWPVLLEGGTALDAVEAAVRVMEDDPTFDAGVGSVLTRDGTVELDAAIMEGAGLRSGAVAAVQRIRNPITLARRVLESDVSLMVGPGAERFAAAAGIPFCDPAELIVERERQIWQELRERGDYRTIEGFANMPDIPPLTHASDTVGAVALDRFGNLVAATSTGGVAYKPAGRVGDSPLIGAGLYADNETGGCSTTGWGETIIKVLLAKTATDYIGAGYDPMRAAQLAVDQLVRRVDGLGGCILLDRQGRIGFAFNTPRMAYAYRVEGGEIVEGV